MLFAVPHIIRPSRKGETGGAGDTDWCVCERICMDFAMDVVHIQIYCGYLVFLVFNMAFVRSHDFI